MNALIFTGLRQPLEYQTVDDPTPGTRVEVVELKAAALNRRDYWITQGLYPGIVFPTILGSDGAGLVGDREVIINPNIGWADKVDFPTDSYRILGLETGGTFCEKIAVHSDRIHDKPAHLSFEQAAALPLAGLTAYRVLFTRCGVRKGERVLITGIGGGVAMFALQFAIAAGAEVYVTSGSDEKLANAIKLGAAGGANYRDEKWIDILRASGDPFDVVIDSAGGKGFSQLVKICRRGARIGIFGGTCGTIPRLSPQEIFFGQISIHGSTMGSDEEFVEMVDFVNRHQIVPQVDSVYELREGNGAMERIAQHSQSGKIVLTCGS